MSFLPILPKGSAPSHYIDENDKRNEPGPGQSKELQSDPSPNSTTAKLVELPEMIIVQTCIMQSDGKYLQNIDKPPNLFSTSSGELRQVPVYYSNLSTTNSKRPTAESATITESYPVRERGIQTEVVKIPHEDKGIQCNLNDEEVEFSDPIFGKNESMDTEGSRKDIKQKFLAFVDKHMARLGKKMHECQLCGEITASGMAMCSHMAVHWGPEVLCYRCGIKFESSILLRQHRCEANKPRNRCRASLTGRLPCPHFDCNFMAISSLELYDHINEHCKEKPYRCLGCNNRFPTAGELRHHLVLRVKCLEKAKKSQRVPYPCIKSKSATAYHSTVFTIYPFNRKRVLVKPHLNKRPKGNLRCQVCLVQCSSRYKFTKHMHRCLKTFTQRWTRRHRNLHKSALLNGS